MAIRAFLVFFEGVVVGVFGDARTVMKDVIPPSRVGVAVPISTFLPVSRNVYFHTSIPNLAARRTNGGHDIPQTGHVWFSFITTSF